VVCGLIGAALGGAAGTMYGAAVASWAGAVLFWLQLRHALRDSRVAPPGAPVAASS